MKLCIVLHCNATLEIALKLPARACSQSRACISALFHDRISAACYLALHCLGVHEMDQRCMRSDEKQCTAEWAPFGAQDMAQATGACASDAPELQLRDGGLWLSTASVPDQLLKPDLVQRCSTLSQWCDSAHNGATQRLPLLAAQACAWLQHEGIVASSQPVEDARKDMLREVRATAPALAPANIGAMGAAFDHAALAMLVRAPDEHGCTLQLMTH